MTEITVGIKTVALITSTTASVVTAYWLARRAAAKDNLELERQFNKLRLQVTTLAAKSQDREEVKELVRESLASLSAMLTALGQSSEANSDELRDVLIQQGILNEKVRALEEHHREYSTRQS